MIALSIVFIVCVFFLAVFFAPDDAEILPGGRFTFAVGIAWWATSLVGIAWLIYIAAHFIGKYW
jgi:hypothetical protein